MPRRPVNHRPDLNGVIVLDKPAGLTSFACCRRIRTLSGGAKVGHAGTLDPLATGVLVIALGAATKTVPALMATEKRYFAEVDFSGFSSTDDLEGEFAPVVAAHPPTREQLIAACRLFEGEIEQRPPMFSAVHVGGERAHHLARKGALVDRPSARRVVIHSIDVQAFAWPIAALDVHCGKGVYIRSLARDLGVALGVGGMLRSLRRTRVGVYTLDQAVTLDALEEHFESHVRPSLLTPSQTYLKDPRTP